jgi:hypothetical protein
MMDKAPESQIGKLSIMDSTGHKELKWNTNSLDEILAAEKTFDSMVKKGYSAFAAQSRAEPKHLIRKFDPTMEETVLVPKLVGG